MSKTARQRLGAAGEAHARRYLESKGYTYRDANWRGGGGEIDLVVEDGAELVFVEVKIRRGESLGTAEESVTSNQQRVLLNAGEAFVGAHPEYHQAIWRFDLVAITLDRSGAVTRVSHVENCFGW